MCHICTYVRIDWSQPLFSFVPQEISHQWSWHFTGQEELQDRVRVWISRWWKEKVDNHFDTLPLCDVRRLLCLPSFSLLHLSDIVLSRTMQRSMTVREKARHVVGAMMVSRVEENQLVKGNDFASQPSNWFQPLEVMLPRRVECSERIQLSLK